MLFSDNFHSSHMMRKIFHARNVDFAVCAFPSLFEKLILLLDLILLSQYEQLSPYYVVFIHVLEKYSEETIYQQDRI
jgi:hypothetical protein